MIGPEELQVGDVLLYSPSDWIGWVIAVKTWTLLSHSEVYCGKGMVYAARSGGVDLYKERLDKYLRFVRRPLMPAGKNFDADAAFEAVRQSLGAPYEFSALASFFMPWLHRHRATMICSSRVTFYLRAGGCEPFNPEVDADDVSPAQLWQTPNLTTIWSRDKI